jgi:hypothetical protein
MRRSWVMRKLHRPAFSCEVDNEMGRWYRRAKKLNLKYLLRDSECEFIFDASQTSMDEFLALQRSLSSIYNPQRLLRDSDAAASPKRILIIGEDPDHPAPSARLQDGWGGVVVTPGDALRRQRALLAFFMWQRRYRISHSSSWVSNDQGEIPPFLLDLRGASATITPAEIVGHRQINRK